MLPTLIGAGLGALQGSANERKSYNEMMTKAALAQYSPWSQLAAQIAASPTADRGGSTEGLFTGAITGTKVGRFFDGESEYPLAAATKKKKGLDFSEIKPVALPANFNPWTQMNAENLYG